MITGTETDVVVIGAGHNGLTAAAYLARAGLRATVVERRHVIGGATVTEEIIPGFRASTCSYVAGLLHPRVLSELELTRFGLKLYQTDASLGNIFPDGRSLFLYNELDRTLNGLRKLSPGEAERFVQFGLRMERFARLTGSIYLEEPPPLSDVVRLFDEAGETELFNEFFTLSVKDLLDRYFESDLLKGLFAFFSIVSVWGGPRLPGTAYVFGHHSAGEYDGRLGQYAFPVGGMGAIADALAACARAAGAQIRTSAPVQRVIVERGRAAGVVLEGGEEIRAPLVVSNADPRTTFLRLMDPDDLPGDFREQVQRIDVRGSMARVFIAVEELPQFDGLPSGDGPQHRGLTLLGGEVERYEEAWDAQRYGRIPDELVIEYIIQTAHDPTVGPPGKHLITTGVQQLPFELEEGTWDDRKDAFTRQVVDQMCRYAPNLRDRIIDTSCITPLDLEREYGMTGGNIFHAAMGLNQLYGSRPLPGFASYRSPVEGLYLCGAGTHPGGAVTMAPGHNAAMTVLRNRSSAKSATTGARGRAAGSPTRTPMIEKVMERPAGRKAGVFLARQRFLRPVVERLSRRKPQ